MGTSDSYGGSTKKVWQDARQQILDLPSGDSAGGDSGDVPANLDDLLDDLWGNVGDALDSDDPALHSPELDKPSLSIPNLLPWLSVPGSSGSGSGGSGGGPVQRTGGGRQGTGSRRQVVRSAARGGMVLGAAHAVRREDSQYLQELGLDLDRLRELSVPRQCGEILDAVLGEGSHPDEAALRRASLESLKEILATDATPDEAESVQTFVANFVFELALVELQAQISDGSLRKEDVAAQEQVIRSYLDRRVETVALAKSRPLTPRDLREYSAKLAKEVIKVLRARTGGDS